jgi:uncharacterized protein YndB with AHSA1/START domain
MRTLESTWVLQTPIEPVWAALFAVEAWPTWWPTIGSIERMGDGDRYGVGAVYRLDGALEFRTCEVNEPHLLEFSTKEGLGRWTLYEEEDLTFIHLSLWGYDQLAEFSEVMIAGAVALAMHLQVRLVEAGSWSAPAQENCMELPASVRGGLST